MQDMSITATSCATTGQVACCNQSPCSPPCVDRPVRNTWETRKPASPQQSLRRQRAPVRLAHAVVHIRVCRRCSPNPAPPPVSRGFLHREAVSIDLYCLNWPHKRDTTARKNRSALVAGGTMTNQTILRPASGLAVQALPVCLYRADCVPAMR